MHPRGTVAATMNRSRGKGKDQQSRTRGQQRQLEGKGSDEPSASSTGFEHPLAEAARRAAHRAGLGHHNQAPHEVIDLTAFSDEESREETPVPRSPVGVAQQAAQEEQPCGAGAPVDAFDVREHSVFVHGRPVQVHLQ